MSLYTTELKPFFEHNLIEELFVVKGKCTICTLAGWKLVAVATDPNVIEKIGGYTGLIVDQKYIESSFFGETKRELTSEEWENYSEEIRFNEKTLEEMIQVKAKIDSGEMQPLYDRNFIKKMKKKYIEQHQDIVEKYGNPPVFSEKKIKVVAMLMFLLGYGGPFFYIGKPLIGMAYIAVSAFACVTYIFWPMMIMGMIGLVALPYLMLSEKMKDRKGLYIVSAKAKERICHIAGTVEKYKEEIEMKKHNIKKL